MKFLIFCLFLISVAFSVNCITRYDAATWTGMVVIQETSGEWAAEPEEYSPRLDGGVCDQVSGYWAIANVHNDGEETAGGPVICTPDSRVIPVGEHSLPDHMLYENACPTGYHEGSIFDATIFFDSHAVGVGRTFKANFYNPRNNYVSEDVVVSPNLKNPKYGYELEYFAASVFSENPNDEPAGSITEVLCVRDDAKFTFAWGDHSDFSNRTAKNNVCSDQLNSNYRAATAAELSANIKSFFSYEDIKDYAQGFASRNIEDPTNTPANPPAFSADYRGIANGIVVADDACRTYLPTYGQWQITPPCEDQTNVGNCTCHTSMVGCTTSINCTAANPANYASSSWTPLVPEFEEIEVPILSVHDNRYSRVTWQNRVTCDQSGIWPDFRNGPQGCVHGDTSTRTIVYGCEATQIGAQSTTDTRVKVPVACIWDPHFQVDAAGDYAFEDRSCPAPVDYVPPTWSHNRPWFQLP